MFRGTTICGVQKNGQTAIAGDGQVSMGDTVMKSNAMKIRRLYDNRVITGFAGATADAITLMEKFEGKLEAHDGSIERAAVELARDWRTDRMLRRLEALMLIADKTQMLLVSGNGDVIKPDESGVLAIGSGGNYAKAAALALVANTELSSKEIAVKALHIAAGICVYTNDHIAVEVIE